MKYAIPLGLFVVMIAFLAVGLNRDPRLIPSPLIDKPAPSFTLPRLDDPKSFFSTEDMKGKVWLLNMWASWCEACRVEHPLLLALARESAIPIYGFDYKDSREAALGWLKNLGNPYAVTVMDPDGRVGIEYGVYGVPESYLIDREGVIRYKRIGPITPEVWQNTIRPLAERLNR